MWLALAVSVGSVAAGAAVVLLGARSRRWLEPVRTFALVAAGVVVVAQLLPAAIGQVGLGALLAFGIALVAPAGFERLARRSGGGPSRTGRDASWIAVELGYIGLLWHKLADGMALGLFGGLGANGAVEVGVLVAIAAHTVPITGVLVLAYADRYGVRQAILRAAGVAAATVAGVLAVGLTPADQIAGWEPWILAVASGLLLHVIGHDWRAEAPRDLGERLADMLAIAAGVGLVLLAAGGDHEHGHAAPTGSDLRPEIFSAFLELSLATAPVLLVGLALAALVQTFGGRISSGWLRGGSALGQALRGAVVGAPLPICVCGVRPLAESLKNRGAGPSLVVAFLLATPALGVESFALTAHFLGWPLALVRLGAAIAVAVVAALALARFSSQPESGIRSEEAVAPGSDREGVARRALDHFEELLHHVGPFTLVGLILAAYTQAALPSAAATVWQGSGLEILLVSLVAIPSYVCAAAAAPLAAVLIGKGFSSGAVLAGLLLGPALNLATLSFLAQAYGRRATWVGLLALVASVWFFAFGANAIGVGAVLDAEHGHSAPSGAATAILLAFILRAIWQNGLRTWLATLADTFGGGHDHDHSHEH